MLVGVATLSPSFPPSGTFYFINRPSVPNILVPSVPTSLCTKVDKKNVPVFFYQSSYENNWDAVKITINLGKLVKKLFYFIKKSR